MCCDMDLTVVKFGLLVTISLALNVVAVHAQCSSPPYLANMVFTPVSQGNYPDGANVTYQCGVGYIAVNGSGLSVCTNQTWTAPTLICTKRSCGNPGEISNGRYDFTNGTLFGAIITVICNTGYQIGNRVFYRQCTVNGWSDRAPICEVIQCGLPPGIANGNLENPNIQQSSYGDVIRYQCASGYTFSGGVSQIVCSQTGAYVPSTVSCIMISCAAPDIPNSVRVEGGPPPYGYKSFVKYDCVEGYQMNGTSQLVCEEQGWSPSIPTCLKATQPTASTTTVGVPMSTTPVTSDAVNATNRTPATQSMSTILDVNATTQGSNGSPSVWVGPLCGGLIPLSQRVVFGLLAAVGLQLLL